ncbi:MAG: NUDIX hydrolase [Minisyncoccia bacterium]
MNKISHDSETLAEGMQVITACVFIHEKFDGIEKVFLPKRASTKKFLPNVFELPGGHIDFGEDIVDGLKREILEECGISISVGDPFAVFTYTNNIKKSRSIEAVYFAKFTGFLQGIKLNPEDHSEFIWVAESEIPEVGSISQEECNNVKKGFALLRGDSHVFG